MHSDWHHHMRTPCPPLICSSRGCETHYIPRHQWLLVLDIETGSSPSQKERRRGPLHGPLAAGVNVLDPRRKRCCNLLRPAEAAKRQRCRWHELLVRKRLVSQPSVAPSQNPSAVFCFQMFPREITELVSSALLQKPRRFLCSAKVAKTG